MKLLGKFVTWVKTTLTRPADTPVIDTEAATPSSGADLPDVSRGPRLTRNELVYHDVMVSTFTSFFIRLSRRSLTLSHSRFHFSLLFLCLSLQAYDKKTGPRKLKRRSEVVNAVRAKPPAATRTAVASSQAEVPEPTVSFSSATVLSLLLLLCNFIDKRVAVT